MSKRTYPIPNKNLSGSDYIQNKRAKQLFSGTSSLAKTIIQQNGNFPLLTPSGKLKPYQGTFGLSGRSEDGNKTYCLNTSHSYRDLLDITKGKYLITPPNVANDNNIQLTDVSNSQKLYNGLYYIYTYNSSNALAYMYPGYPNTPASYVGNKIQYDITTNANQRIIVDPSYVITYSSESCVLHPNVGRNITINNDYDSKFSFNRTINLDLLTGFQYPIKFNMEYDDGDCINVNNDIQSAYALPAEPNNITPPVINGFEEGSPSTLVLKVINDGTWIGFPTPTFTYRWFRGSIPIASATSDQYSVNPSLDVNNNITCRITGTNSSGSDTATSNVITPKIPANTTLPVISGSAVVGNTLTTTNGTWTAYPAITSYAYLWLRNGLVIGGETNSTYTTQSPADVGQSITCAVIASNLFGSSSPAISNALTPTSVPVNSVAPVISGNAAVGNTLTTTNGTWTASPTTPPLTYTYQWRRNGSTISGETNSTYTTQSPADVGQSITCQVTAVNGVISSSPATSNTITPTSAPVNTAPPAMSGNLVVGNTLTTTNGTWIAFPSPTFTYKWFRNGSQIGGETNSTYTTQSPSDVGQSITCSVTATNGIIPNATATSNALTPTSVPVISTPLPSITPTTIDAGSPTPLTCSTGTWTASPTTPPLTYNYQWYRGASPISGETNSTYTTLSPADIGQQITCRVTAINGVISSSPATSSNSVTPTSVPVLSTAPSSSPSVTPTTIVAGSATPLTCSTGTWIANPAITSYAYQWYRGASPISGETNSTYTTLTPTDVGQQITCQVTATNSIGSSSPAASNSVTPT